MGNPLSMMRRWFSTRLRDEDGTATIPFIIFVPFLLTLVMASLEMGMLMTRWVMLERALDLTVRDLRLGHLPEISREDFRDLVCDRSALIPDCKSVMLIELRPVSTTTWAPLNTGAVCVDRGNPDKPLDYEFRQGAGDELMLVRACAKFDPIFDTSAVGLNLPKDDAGAYALVTQTAYVNEPELGG